MKRQYREGLAKRSRSHPVGCRRVGCACPADVDPETGEMKLTERQEREAARLAEEWGRQGG